jgi:MOSC domain-containing protein YiiM
MILPWRREHSWTGRYRIGMGAVLVSLNIATDDQILTGAWTGRKRRTGIGKLPVAARIDTGFEQLVGDNICDLDNHGGADQAVYAYSVEDAQWWSTAMQRHLVPGAFGENFTTSGLDLTQAVIGERWAVGSAIFACPGSPGGCSLDSGTCRI